MKLYVLGNGPFTSEILEYLDTSHGSYGGCLHIENNILMNKHRPFDFPAGVKFILGTGNMKYRKLFLDIVLDKYKATTNIFPNIICKNVYISKTADIKGCGNIFAPGTTIIGNAKVGSFNLFNIHSSASHDNIIHNNNVFSPYTGIMGNCSIGNNNFFATRATIAPNITIGDNNTISIAENIVTSIKNRQFIKDGLIKDKP